MAKKRYIILISLLLCVTLLIACGKKPEETQETIVEKDYIPVEVLEANTGEIYNLITLTGKVHGNKEVMIIPAVPGKVSKVLVNVGDKVKEDQELLTIDKRDIEQQIKTAKKQVDSAYSNYIKTKDSVQLAKTTYERTLELYNQNGVSKAQLEQAKLQASDSLVEATKSQYDVAVLGLEKVKDMLNDSTIKSPIDGVITGVNVESGEMMSAASSAITVVDMDSVYVEMNITETIINELFVGQSVDVKINAIDQVLMGKIDRISPVADSRTNLYPVRVYLDNDDFKIKPGMFAKIDFKIDYKESVLRIPSESVVAKGTSMYVYVANGDVAVEKQIEVGIDSGDYVEVLSGINAGDKLIVKGQQYLKNNSSIKVVRGDK